MNVYDFDGTIYDGDSTVDFYRFILHRHPSVALGLPKAAVYAVRYKLKKCTKTEFKQAFFSFLKRVPDVEREVERFWIKNKRKLKRFYCEQRRDDDLIISASPRFLLEPVCAHLIASEVDKSTGEFLSENCRGEEKVKRLYSELGREVQIELFYSDSASDLPLALLSERAFLVKGNRITEWRK